jgi:hypothetical protein
MTKRSWLIDLPQDSLATFNSVAIIRQVPVWQLNKTNSVAFSPQANYTDWPAAICWRNLVPTFEDRGVSRGQHTADPVRSLISVF